MEKQLKVTVCEMEDEPTRFAEQWDELVGYVKKERSDLVVLPEMAFDKWLPETRNFNQELWDRAVKNQEKWLERLVELAPAMIAASRPVNKSGKRLNEGFIWDKEKGYLFCHHKYHLPESEGVWERSWYHRGSGEFKAAKTDAFTAGFLICSDLWFFQHSRQYGMHQGCQLLINPRKTERKTVDKWIVAGKASAIVGGCFSLSANSATPGKNDFGGASWIINPNGIVLAQSSEREPFVSAVINLKEAQEAKSTYPRELLD
ncbi:MAG: carbon-nitrogen hydrolase family protein [Deltaproteobacteria bacterium]|nr:carbon-nitrogen hydrolase family protein [Deltaproteobacteria bacterium]